MDTLLILALSAPVVDAVIFEGRFIISWLRKLIGR